MATLAPTTGVMAPKLICSAPALSTLIGIKTTGLGRQIIDCGPSKRGPRFFLGSGQSITAGNPVGSLRLSARAIWSTRLPIIVGARQISVQVQHVRVGSGFRPVTFRVAPNPSIGLNAALTASSTDTTAWQTLGPLTFTATANGGVNVEIQATIDDPEVAYIDNLILI